MRLGGRGGNVSSCSPAGVRQRKVTQGAHPTQRVENGEFKIIWLVMVRQRDGCLLFTCVGDVC